MNSGVRRNDSRRSYFPAAQLHSDIEGLLLIDKEPGWTSHDVCAFIRKRFHIKRVGHAGTLDPQATGLLVILLGRTTKHSERLSASDKEYAGRIRLGIKTDSQDSTGKVIAEKDVSGITEEQVRDAFRRFQGSIMQKPPMVSALKHQGVRLYKLARAGKEVERPLRPVTIYEFRIEKIELPAIEFFARVSKGTYVRTLANDLGEFLGCYAVLDGLKRIRSGNFFLEDAVTISELRNLSEEDLRRYVQPVVFTSGQPINASGSER